MGHGGGERLEEHEASSPRKLEAAASALRARREFADRKMEKMRAAELVQAIGATSFQSCFSVGRNFCRRRKSMDKSTLWKGPTNIFYVDSPLQHLPTDGSYSGYPWHICRQHVPFGSGDPPAFDASR